MTERQKILLETTVAKDKADALLKVLVEAKQRSEEHMRELGQHDTFKRVTGRSSLDNAIASTRRMVETLRRTEAQLQRDLCEADAVLIA
jgi:hypothetical protein